MKARWTRYAVVALMMLLGFSSQTSVVALDQATPVADQESNDDDENLASPLASPDTGQSSQQSTGVLTLAGNTDVQFTSIELVPDGPRLDFRLNLVDNPAAGTTITITYPTNVFVLDETERYLGRYHTPTDQLVTVATMQPDNSTGLITITFVDPPYEEGYLDYYLYGSFAATIQVTQCDPTKGPYIGGFKPWEYETSTGETFADGLDDFVCNSVPASKTGEFIENESETAIRWHIDSGTILHFGQLSDMLMFPGEFDCNADAITVTTYGNTVVEDPLCAGGIFVLYFSSPDIARVGVDIVSYSSDAEAPYLNCVDVSQSSQSRGVAGITDIGVGSTACYELFPDGGGDVITKDVDKAEAFPGDEITYTIVVSTSTSQWSGIHVTDTIPDELTVTSVSCEVDPGIYASSECYTLESGVLKVNVWPIVHEGDEVWWETDPVTITLVIKGVVREGTPAGTEIVNEACSIRQSASSGLLRSSRSMGDPTIPGGGLICDSAETLVLGKTVPEPVEFLDAACDVNPVVTLPTNGKGITYTMEGDTVPGGTVTVYAAIDLDEYRWGDLAGTGWIPAGESRNVLKQVFEIADPDCRTEVVPEIAFTEATCTEDAKVTVLPVDGVTYSTVTEIGAGKTVVINASVDLNTHKWGNLTGTDWEPKEGDTSTVVATHTFNAAPDCITPTATTPATPGATPTTTAEPTATVGVTELPKTGSTSGNGSAFQFLAAALVASVAVAAIGIRATESRK